MKRTLILAAFAAAELLTATGRGQTFTDAFTTSTNWGTPTLTAAANLSVSSGRMNYTCTSTANNGGFIARKTPLLSTTQDWSLQVDVHLNAFSLTTEGQFSDVFLGVGKTGDEINTHVTFEFGRGRWGSHIGYYIGDDVRISGSDAAALFDAYNLTSSGNAALRMDYSAANHTITYYFDADGATGGYAWVNQGSADIASGTYNLGLGAADTLSIILVGSSAYQTVSNGQAYWSNLAISPGVTTLTEFTYTTNSGAITITGYTGSDKTVTIPNTINELPVTGIADYAFNGSTLTSIIVSSNVVYIGDWAFVNGTPLESFEVNPLNPAYSSRDGVLFNKSQTKLIQYPNAKTGNYYSIPDSVTNIGDLAFFNRTYLTSISIPIDVSSIGDSALGGCPILTNITVNPQNTIFSSKDGVLFDKKQSRIIQFPAGKAGFYAIPNGVSNIGNFAFEWCVALTGLTIPDGITSIGDFAFNGPDLPSITIPAGVTNIGSMAFQGWFSLTSVFFKGNPPMSVGSDVFFLDDNATVYYLLGTTNWSSTFGGRPAVLWNPQARTSGANFGVRTNRFGFSITAVTGTNALPFVVEACTNLSTPVWFPLLTNTGSVYFSDPQWTNYLGRFYRVRTP